MYSKPKKLNKAVLIVESQPPHLGELLQLLSQLNKYDLIYLCINGKEKVMNYSHVLQLWQFILQPYVDKVNLMLFPHNLTEFDKDDIPELLDECLFLTASREIFVRLSTIGCQVEMIPQALGYRSLFFRTAFRQSKALDWLESRFVNSATNVNENER